MSQETGASRSEKVLTGALVLLACVAGAAALFLGREFFVPIALAFLLNALFRPIVRGLQRLGVPAPVGATLVVLGILAIAITAGALLRGPMSTWMAKAPELFSAAEEKLNRLPVPLRGAADVARQAAQATTGPTTTPGAVDPPAPSGGAVLRFFGATTQVLGGLIEVLVLLLLLLASGDLFFQKLIKVTPRLRDKRAAADVVSEAEGVVVRYMVVNAIINGGQGVLVALAMWWLKMPSPLLWGVFTFVLEFIPYLGAAIMVGLLAVVGLATFDSIGHALLPPAIYLLITTLQNNLVSPVAYGRHLKLNTVAVFVGVVFWWFLWGISGAFLAVPILATIKIVADHSEGLKPVGEFLGE